MVRISNNMPSSKQCYFCTSNIKSIDYKDREGLKRFIDPQSRIMPKRRSGVCALHQRKLAQAIKRARFMGILPYFTH